MKIAVTGDREYPRSRYGEVYEVIQTLHPDSTVLVGDAAGLDSLVRDVCKELGLEHIVFHANWSRYGKAAGPYRNTAMLQREPEEVWWWHRNIKNSKGTKNMLLQARSLGIPTIDKTKGI